MAHVVSPGGGPKTTFPRDHDDQAARADKLRKFQRRKAKNAAELERQKAEPDWTEWVFVHEHFYPGLVQEFPPKFDGESSRSVQVWLRYSHSHYGRYVVAQGYYDFEQRLWRARTEKGLLRGEWDWVKPIEWARIKIGVLPKDSLLINKTEMNFTEYIRDTFNCW